MVYISVNQKIEPSHQNSDLLNLELMSFPLKNVQIFQISRYLSFLINSNKDTIKKRILLFNKILIFRSYFGVYLNNHYKGNYYHTFFSRIPNYNFDI